MQRISASLTGWFQAVDEAISFQTCVSNPGPLLTFAFDCPPSSGVNQSHPSPQTPPIIDLLREGNPNASLLAQTREMSEQPNVCISRFALDYIIGVDNKVKQPVLLRNGIDLINPQIDRKLPENIKQRIILHNSDG